MSLNHLGHSNPGPSGSKGGSCQLSAVSSDLPVMMAISFVIIWVVIEQQWLGYDLMHAGWALSKQ